MGVFRCAFIECYFSFVLRASDPFCLLSSVCRNAPLSHCSVRYTWSGPVNPGAIHFISPCPAIAQRLILIMLPTRDSPYLESSAQCNQNPSRCMGTSVLLPLWQVLLSLVQTPLMHNLWWCLGSYCKHPRTWLDIHLWDQVSIGGRFSGWLSADDGSLLAGSIKGRNGSNVRWHRFLLAAVFAIFPLFTPAFRTLHHFNVTTTHAVFHPRSSLVIWFTAILWANKWGSWPPVTFTLTWLWPIPYFTTKSGAWQLFPY